MVDIDSAQSNHLEVPSDDLSSLFETLADWEYELQKLSLEDRAYLASDIEEPAP